MPRPKGIDELIDYDIDNEMDVASGLEYLSQGARLVTQAANAYSDYKEADEAVGRATSSQTRTSSEAGLNIDREGRCKMQRVSQTTPVGSKSLNAAQHGIGASSTQVIGNSTAPPIRLTLGKQLGPINSVENFLSLMNAHGIVSGSFGGRLRSKQDTRVRAYNIFRHNLHGDDNLTENGAYPAGTTVMFPTGSLTASMTGGNAQTAVLSPSQIRDVDDASITWSYYNKPDLEDVSWNLNKFKIGPQNNTGGTQDFDSTVNGASPKVQILDDVKTLRTSAHRAFSAIYQNNERHDASVSNGISAPYVYDSVFKQGTVQYLFMNKGESPCEVELVVYRVKKTGVQGVPTKWSDLAFKSQLEAPITQGMVKKVLSGLGTDAMAGGHVPAGSDWVSNPNYPFLPKSRFIDQSSTPYTEVQRVKLVMQSGQRRPFQLKLGGIKYDPTTNVLHKKLGSIADVPTLCPLMDQYSYIVCIALNGIAMSRQLSGVTKSDSSGAQLTFGPIVGDTHADADLQWYGTYSEDVGAMAYKKVRPRNMFSQSSSGPFQDALTVYNGASGAADQISSTPVALLTQAQAVRLSTASSQTSYGGATSGTATYSTNSTNTQSTVGGSTTTP